MFRLYHKATSLAVCPDSNRGRRTDRQTHTHTHTQTDGQQSNTPLRCLPGADRAACVETRVNWIWGAGSLLRGRQWTQRPDWVPKAEWVSANCTVRLTCGVSDKALQRLAR